MNCIPGMGENRTAAASGIRRHLAVVILTAAAVIPSACDAPASDLAMTTDNRSRLYQLDYVVTPKPALGGVIVELTLRQPQRLLRELDMRLAGIDVSSIVADGKLSRAGNRLVWHPPTKGGVIRWFASVNHERSEGAYDAYMSASWALFRNEDIIPPARTRTLKGARSVTRLKFELPPGWSSTTQYYGRNNDYRIENPERRFDQPTGWVLLGKLGKRNDDIEGIRVIVAGPVEQSVRRLDMLALLHWTLPELRRILPDFPRRLTIISAADPMWHGGLSAPKSLFIHADIPLISENGTSVLLHELLHAGLRLRADAGADWIIEGLAEYYGLELLRRSHTISARRHATAIEGLRDWGGKVTNLCQKQSTGATTARATVIFHNLDTELRQYDDGNMNYNLDDLVANLRTNNARVTVQSLQDAAVQLIGSLPAALETSNLPGCAE